MPPGKISIDDLETPSAARSALREHFETCNKGLKRFKHHNLEEWLQGVQEGDLHLVVRHSEYCLRSLSSHVLDLYRPLSQYRGV